MLNRILRAGLLAATVVMSLPDRTMAADVRIGVSIGSFHDRLAPYGQWVSVGRYGSGWRPYRVARTWRPYTAGYWAYTDYGWTWVSSEPWGWATYHYGRWVYDPYYGWVWVPGTRWAPAYVTWRYSDDWVGWAPLPPGIEPGVFVNVNIAPSAYSFVQTRYFLDHRLGGHFAPESRNAFLIGSTRNATRYDFEGSRIINRGVDPAHIQRMSGRAVEHLRVRDSAVPTRARVSNNELSVYRPSVNRNSAAVSRSGEASSRVERRIERTPAPRFERAPRPSETRQAAQVEQRRAERQMRVDQPRRIQQQREQPQPRADRQSAPMQQRHEARASQERATTGRVPSAERHGGGDRAPHGGGGARGDRDGGGHKDSGGGSRNEGGDKHKKG